MQPLVIKYCGHFNMKYPMGKCVWLGLYQGLEEVGKFSFGGYMNRQCIRTLHQKYECINT